MNPIFFKRIFGVIMMFLVFCTSCDTSEKEDDYTVVNVKSNSSEVGKIERDVTFIMLDEEALFSSISKMIIQDDKIFILDGNLSTIHVLNLSGELLKKIDYIGQGPGEYVRLRDFTVKNNHLYLYDDRMKKILCYNLDDFKYVNAIETSFFARAFTFLNNGNMLFVLPKDQRNKQIVITDSLCNILSEHLAFDDDDMDNRTRYGLLQETDLGIIYSKPESNNVYLFSKDDGRLIEKYIFKVDGREYARENKTGPELNITPIMMKDGNVYGNYIHQRERFFFHTSYMDNHKSIITKVMSSENNTNRLLYPVCSVGDSIIASYLLEEVYEKMNHKIPLNDVMETYLKDGGFLICLYHVK